MKNHLDKEKFVPLKDIGVKIHLWEPRQNYLIWGAGINASKIYLKFKKFSKLKNLIGFFDNSKKPIQKFYGKTIFDKKSLNETLKKKKKILIVKSIPFLSNSTFLNYLDDKIKSNCDISFIPISFFYRPEAIVELTNAPLMQYELGSDEYLSFEDAMERINFVEKNYPDIFNIDLSGSKDPFENPNLTKILKKLDKFTFITLHTNINNENNLKKINQLAKIKKSIQIVIIINEINLKYNPVSLNTIKKYISKISKIRKINIFLRIRYDNYNLFPKLKKNVFKYCLNKVRIIEALGYINSYENILNFITKKKWIDKKSEIESKLIPWRLKDYIRKSQFHKHKPCLCQRIFPVINFNGNINVCHLYDKTNIVSFSKTLSKKKLIRNRYNSNLCRKCQKFALHRLDIDILNR